MQCTNHGDRPATAVCNHCGKNICSECLIVANGENYCKTCMASKVETVKKEERSPALACILSFVIGGLGQIYNGQIGKGILIFFTSWLIIPWIIGIVDAYRTAVAINEGRISVKSRPGCLIAAIIGVFFFSAMMFFIILLAAIAIPNLLKARLMANEAAAQAELRSVATAIESYRTANNGTYPASESDLLNGPTPYLTKSFDRQSMSGYRYVGSFGSYGYVITANPDACGTSGRRIFTITKDGALVSQECRSGQ
jgi:Tfp pilus assembly protein PilE